VTASRSGLTTRTGGSSTSRERSRSQRIRRWCTAADPSNCCPRWKSSAHWPEGSLHIERFAAKAPAEPTAEALETFQVVCQRSGVTVEVSGETSILEALEDADVPILSSCLEGICGTCEAKVLEGTPDHRDSMLTDAERASGNKILTCVSRSCSEKLVLDL